MPGCRDNTCPSMCVQVTITVAISFMVEAFVSNVEAISEDKQRGEQAYRTDGTSVGQ